MFNAEKYLPVCLESILIQTLTDFEVIVVDDASTDSSLTIAESYLARFGGRLKVVTLPTNTGSGGVPRNVGLDLSCGKYVYFMDDDDLIVDNALETLYGFAEKFGTDVVYMEKYFLCDTTPVPKTFDLVDYQADLPDENSTEMFESDDIAIRVERFLNKKFWCAPWSKFFRRDFLVDNEIKFPRMPIADDVLWTLKICCLAKKFLRIPSRLYLQRNNEHSISRLKRSPKNQIDLFISPLIHGVENFDEFMNGQDFFVRHPDYRLRMLMFFVNLLFDEMDCALKSLRPVEVYEMIFRRFFAEGSTQPAFIACLAVMTNIYKQTLKARGSS